MSLGLLCDCAAVLIVDINMLFTQIKLKPFLNIICKFGYEVLNTARLCIS